jgi:hypothetical protein
MFLPSFQLPFGCDGRSPPVQEAKVRTTLQWAHNGVVINTVMEKNCVVLILSKQAYLLAVTDRMGNRIVPVLSKPNEKSTRIGRKIEISN